MCTCMYYFSNPFSTSQGFLIIVEYTSIESFEESVEAVHEVDLTVIRFRRVVGIPRVLGGGYLK